MIEGLTTPSAPTAAPPYRPLPDSTVPIAASSDQVRWHPGSVRASPASAARYAARAGAGMPGAARAPGTASPDCAGPGRGVAGGEGGPGRGGTSWIAGPPENPASTWGSTAAAGYGRSAASAGSGAAPGGAAAAAVRSADAVRTATARPRAGMLGRRRTRIRTETTQRLLDARRHVGS